MDMVARIRRYRKLWLVLPLCALALLFGVRLASQQRQPSQAQPPADPHAAIRANNLGAAYLNQQRMEQALAQFKNAQAADPKLAAARVNEAIALLNLQRIEPARIVFNEIVAHDPENIRAWYNLGLLEKNAGNAEKALAAFEKAAALDPDDADSHYFIGTLHSQLQRYEPAIAAFERAIKLNRFHVSAEFGLARAMQRLGNAEQARLHLARFQHLNTEKLGAPMSLAYGDQGKYSLAETVTLPPAAAPPPIPIKFTPVPASESGLGEALISKHRVRKKHDYSPPGACIGDFDNDGTQDVFMVSGLLLRNRNDSFEPTPLENLGLGESPYSCAVGDYDNDGRIDIVVTGDPSATELLRNTGNGTFDNVTRSVGIGSDANSMTAAFLDFDHDGDLDIFILRELKSSNRGNALCRNNGNGTFMNWTAATGLDWPGSGRSLALGDFNGDRAIDIAVAGALEPPVLFVNPREGTFQRLPIWNSRGSERAATMAVLDFDRDGSLDFIFQRSASPDLTLWRNVSGRSFVRVPIPKPRW
ncbi:MAG: FG-GAP-like repeat-containing protein, partial [Candidatus Acidiferrales bacterium]